MDACIEPYRALNHNVLVRRIQRFLARRARRGLPTSGPTLAACPTRRRPPPCPPRLRPRSRLCLGACITPPCTRSCGLTTKSSRPRRRPTRPQAAWASSGAAVCSRTGRAARGSQAWWHRLADELGLGLSNDKRQLPSQRVTYTGMVVATFHRTISIPPVKKVRLAGFLEGFFDLREAFPVGLGLLPRPRTALLRMPSLHPPCCALPKPSAPHAVRARTCSSSATMTVSKMGICS